MNNVYNDNTDNDSNFDEDCRGKKPGKIATLILWRLWGVDATCDKVGGRDYNGCLQHLR
jgi:hypothetical protein